MELKLKRIPHIIRQLKFQSRIPIYKRHEETGYEGAQMRFSHVTYYACGNVGDTVLSACVRQTFKKLNDNVGFKLYDVDAKVDATQQKEFNASSAVIVGGGGLFLPDSNPNSISGWQWAIDVKDLNTITAPIFIYSVGFNYFHGQVPSQLFVDSLNMLVDKSCFVGLRNKGSIKAVQSLLSPELRDKVVYQPCTTTLINTIYNQGKGTKCTGRKVAINMAFDRIELRLGKDYDEKLQNVARGFKKIQDKGYEIVYVAHCYEDLKFVPYLRKQGVKFVAKDISTWFPDRVIEFYGGIDTVVGMRGHAQMIPFGAGCKILTLGSHDKMRWFLEDIDCTEWYLDLNEDKELLDEKLVALFLTIQEEEKAVRRKIIEKSEMLWNITKKNMDEIKDRLI